MDVDLDAVEDWNAAMVVSLIENDEIVPSRRNLLERGVRSRHIVWHHLPAARTGEQTLPLEALWRIVGNEARQVLRSGGNVLVHSMTGEGRAATIAARLLVELGDDRLEAITKIQSVRPGSFANPFHLQRIMELDPIPECKPLTDSQAVRDRALGAFLGGAIGDALGVTHEFHTRDTFLQTTELMGGGPYDLRPGEWTDDTASMLALADSLLHNENLDEADFMGRLLRCQDAGAYSCSGTCFDLGVLTRKALERWNETGDPIAGSINPMTAGNGSLVRLLPVVIRHLGAPDRVFDIAKRQSRTTHGAAAAVDACVVFAGILSQAILGYPRSEVLKPSVQPCSEPVATVMAGSWQGKRRDQIESSAYVVYSLEAALWCVARTGNFEDAVRLSANLGNDSDTIASLTGQLAGALYGREMIPARWSTNIAWRDKLENVAHRLLLRSNIASICSDKKI